MADITDTPDNSAAEIVRPRGLPRVLDVSRTTSWRVSREPGFPKKVHIHGNVYGWRKCEIAAWIAKRA